MVYTKQKATGLQFNVYMIRRRLKDAKVANKIRITSAIYLGAVLEYLIAEVLELSGNAARDNKKRRIVPRHITLAVRNDEELNTLLKDVTISQGGVAPHIHMQLLPQKSSLKPKPASDKKKKPVEEDPDSVQI